MNIENITKVLQTKSSYVYKADELLYMSKALERLKLGTVRTVTTYTELPTFAEDGSLYFIDDENALYFRVYTRWLKVYNAHSGYMWGTGFNASGQLGQSPITLTSTSSPVSVAGGISNWTQVSAGRSHTLALRADGTVWAWGDNTNGQLSTGDTTSRSSPVAIVGGFTDWVEISSGNYHGAGLRLDGTIWIWGFNAHGQLGTDDVAYRSSPVSVVGGITDWVQVSCGERHTMAIRSNGTAWGWGYNNIGGRLGIGSLDSKRSPTSVIGGITDWVQISGGGRHTMAIRSNGTAWGWGDNIRGQLGDNSATSRLSPVSVVGGFNDWMQISAGGYHTVGIRNNGTAWAWGYNHTGQLADGTTTTSRRSPVLVVGGFTDWAQVSAGGFHTAAIRANGTAWGWGFNNQGQLGDNSATSRLSPVSVVGGFTDWVQVSCGRSNISGHTMVIKTS